MRFRIVLKNQHGEHLFEEVIECLNQAEAEEAALQVADGLGFVTITRED